MYARYQILVFWVAAASISMSISISSMYIHIPISPCPLSAHIPHDPRYCSASPQLTARSVSVSVHARMYLV